MFNFFKKRKEKKIARDILNFASRDESYSGLERCCRVIENIIESNTYGDNVNLYLEDYLPVLKSKRDKEYPKIIHHFLNNISKDNIHMFEYHYLSGKKLFNSFSLSKDLKECIVNYREKKSIMKFDEYTIYNNKVVIISYKKIAKGKSIRIELFADILNSDKMNLFYKIKDDYKPKNELYEEINVVRKKLNKEND